MLRIEPVIASPYAEWFCRQFIDSSRPKYVFGTNSFAASIAGAVKLDGFIDDFSSETQFLGLPLVPIDEIPDDGLVVSAVTIGKPLKAERRLRQHQFHSLDYFAFFRQSGLELEDIWYWGNFPSDIEINRPRYDSLYSRLEDKTSRDQLYNLINFRLSYDLNYMRGFMPIEDRQYFEPFLELSPDGETFLDVGAFDGYTSGEFIRRCPGYDAVYLYEPERKNIELARSRLKSFSNIFYLPVGLFNRKDSLKFSAEGASSKFSPGGESTIQVDTLDDTFDARATFIKMDIEGAELEALEGARETILRDHPRLAIAAYHQADHLWKIPQTVFAIRDDYSLYLRHYTEGFAETVLFFIPRPGK